MKRKEENLLSWTKPDRAVMRIVIIKIVGGTAMSFSPTPLASTDAQLRQSSIMNQVYAWMTAGLLVTGAVAAYTANSRAC